MKALVCRACLDVRALPPQRRVAVTCRCGLCCAWWEDPHAGIARFAEATPRSTAYFIGFHNRFMVTALTESLDDEGFRALHAETTHCPGYHFDRSKKDCWAILLRPGLSSDTEIVSVAPADLDGRPHWLPGPVSTT